MKIVSHRVWTALFFSLLILSCLITQAQQTLTESYSGFNSYTGTSYPKGSTRTITRNFDGQFNDVITVTDRDNANIRFDETVYTRYTDGRVEMSNRVYSPTGELITEKTYQLNADNKLIYITVRDSKHPENNREVIPDAKLGYVNKTTGKMADEFDFTMANEVPKIAPVAFRQLVEKLEKAENKSQGLPTSSASTGNDRLIKNQAFIGYSPLLAKRGDESEFFPLGAEVYVLHIFTPHIAAGVDFSYHTKKDDPVTLSNSFYMARISYSNYQNNTIDSGAMLEHMRVFRGDVHMMVGYSTETRQYDAGTFSSKSKGSGFAFGAGLGGCFAINNSLGIQGNVDLIGVKYKNVDDLNLNIRASIGLQISFPPPSP